MPRNTLIFVSFLAVFAALIAGVNVANYLNPGRNTIGNSSEIQTETPSPTPTIKYNQYQACSVSFSYPDKLTRLDVAESGVMLVDTARPKESVAIICQTEIPRPDINSDQTEEIMIGSTSAILFHDTTESTGSSNDKLIFTHPKTGLDVMISGFGNAFDNLLKSLSLL